MRRVSILVLLLTFAGCRTGSDSDGGDGGGPSVEFDAGFSGTDAGGSDAGMEFDGGVDPDGGTTDGGIDPDGGMNTDGGMTDAGVRVTPGAEVVGGAGRLRSATYTFDVELGNPVGQQPSRSTTYTIQGNTPVKP